MKTRFSPPPPRPRTRAARAWPAGPPGARAFPPRRQRAFSLLEIAGVLSVLTILASLALPSLLQQLSELARRQELERLSQIGQGLREYILRAHQVPALNTLATNVAEVLGWPVRWVLETAAGQPRVFLYDPELQIGTTTASTLPYVQTTSGAAALSGARFLIVSSLGAALPSVIGNPGSNAVTVFNLLWDAPDGTPPPGWTWGGEWRQILVQRVNLQPLFTRVVLNNNHIRFGRYSVDNTNAPVALTTNSFTAFFLGRTQLGLHGDGTGPLQSVQLVPSAEAASRDPTYAWYPSYVYERGIWRGRLFMETPLPRRSGNDLQAAYEIFMSGPPNVYKVGSVTQSSVTWAMYNFMSNYVVWANSGFSTSAKVNVTLWQSSMATQVKTYCNKKASTK
jgi:type II secretory pathway pseudopilin PulG